MSRSVSSTTPSRPDLHRENLRCGARRMPLWGRVLAGCLVVVVALVGAGGARAGVWSMRPVPAPRGPDSTLSDISCNSMRSCMAVGSSAAGAFAERWNGRRWTLTPTSALRHRSTDVALQSVSCSSADACTAVGSDRFGPLIERWNGRRWSRQRPGAGSSIALSSVSCGSANLCVAVGNYTGCGSASCFTSDDVQLWDGRKWRLERLQVPAGWWDFSVSSVACASATACMTVGYVERGGGCSGGSGNCDQLPLAEGWDGSRWAILPAPNVHGARLVALSCRSTEDCVVLATSALHRRAVMFAGSWDGSSWTVRSIPAPRRGRDATLKGVSCRSAQDCVAVGSFIDHAHVRVPFAVHWNGQRWQLGRVVVPPGDRQLTISAVSCQPARACFAVGGFVTAIGRPATLVERWRRSRWSVQRSANYMTDIDAELNDVSCVSDTSCTAVGSTVNVDPGAPLVEHWDGSTWTIQKLPAYAIANSFNAISCDTSAVCAAVGSSTHKSARLEGSAAIASNGHWSIERVSPGRAFDSSLSGVSCASTTECMAVGYYQLGVNSDSIPFAALWRGAAWVALGIPLPVGATSATLQRLSCSSTETCIAMGSYTGGGSSESEPLVEAWNGSAWSVQEAAVPPGASTPSLNGVACLAGNTCMAVGSFQLAPDHTDTPLAEMLSGTSWSLLSTSGSGELRTDSCLSATLCVAVGEHAGQPFALAWNGSTWSTEPTPAVPSQYFDAALDGVSCGARTSCLAVGTRVSSPHKEGESYQAFSEQRS